MRFLPLLLPAIMLAAPAPAQTSPAAARATVQRYYAAIDRGDFAVAYRLWGDEGRRSGKSYSDFARGFAATAQTRVVAGAPRNQQGAAGSIFIDVPVNVHARLKNGRRQHFRGTYVLRRVNDVDGATAEQRVWRIAAARLRPVA